MLRLAESPLFGRPANAPCVPVARGMDVYKWAFKLSPLVPSDLVADAFDLAREIRLLDMQASPYDLRELGYEAVPPACG
jgi:hypothetical protein